jgi:murein DD-endopeptidase MepM/ murein hydrolase activator NlpD
MVPRTFAPGEVPSTFAPDVSQGATPISPANSPWVSPMRNAAPGLLTQTGSTLMQAGDTEAKLGNTIGDRVQDTMDDAQTKAAETQFLSAALPMLGQYKSTEGINATQQFDPTAQAIVKARQDARTSLTNPIQQNMFDQVTNNHLLTLGQQMADHENVQRVQYGKDQAKARAESLNTMSTLDVAGRNRDDSNFAKFGAQSDAEVLNYAGLSGVAPDSPQADQMLRQNRTDRYRSVVTSLLDQHAYNEASDFFDAHKDEMDMRQAEMMGNAVKSASKAEQVTEFRNQAVQSLQKTPGAGPLTQPIPAGTISTTDGVDGIDIHTAPGTNVHAPASGTVTKVWMDPQLGRSAQIALPNGYTATFNGLGAVNYTEGQKITQGQTLGLTGKDDTGQGVMHYAMTDPDGKYIDPRQAVSAPFDPKNFSSPADEEKAVGWVNANVSDPVQQREAESQVRSLASMNRQIDNQEHAAVLKQATDYWFDNGQSLAGLPHDVSMQLTPEDLNGFNEKAKQEYLLNQSVLGEKEVNLLASWDADPKQQTVDTVRQAYAQGQLSNASYLTALRQATAMQGNEDKIRAVTTDHDQLTDIFTMNQLPNLAEPKTTADKVQRVQLETAIKNEIDNQQQKNGRVLSWDEKGKIARDMTIDKVYTSGVFSTSGGLKPVATLTPDEQSKATVWIGNQSVRMMDIPPRYTVQAMQDLQSNGMPSTQANIAAWWLRQGKPTK